MSNAGAEVVICGGGAIGASIAYHLGKRGVRSLIIESDAVASGASGAAAGGLTPPSPQQEQGPEGTLLRKSFERHEALAETLPAESGVDYSYARTPSLVITTTEDGERAARAEAERRLEAGRPGRWLDRDEVRAQFDWIDGDIRGALRAEDAGELDPYRFTLALVTAAERAGASVTSGRVMGLERLNGRVTGVRLASGVIPAGSVVIAMGPWSHEAGEWLGCPVPVEPLKGQIVRVRPPRELRRCSLSSGSGDYIMAKLSGAVLLGTTEERVGFDTAPTAEARESILEFGLRFASILGEAEVVEQTACLRPLSADGLPIIGPAPGLDGAYVATGHGRKGILESTATGQAMADLIVDGHTDCIDLSPFDPARFLPDGAGEG